MRILPLGLVVAAFIAFVACGGSTSKGGGGSPGGGGGGASGTCVEGGTCTGCCDTSGVCQNGTLDVSCGAPGHVCEDCTSVGTTCVAGKCGSAGTSSGGSSGGGSTSGGTSSGAGSMSCPMQRRCSFCGPLMTCCLSDGTCGCSIGGACQ